MTKEQFLIKANKSWLIRLFMFKVLPGAWFFGIKVKSVTEKECSTTLPYGWRTQNPFRSTYFAAQMAAAEFSTGLLVMAAMQNQPPISMLVAKNYGEYFKKVDQTLTFVCKTGEKASQAIEHTLKTGEGIVIEMISEGFLPDGTLASRFSFFWSIKKK